MHLNWDQLGLRTPAGNTFTIQGKSGAAFHPDKLQNAMLMVETKPNLSITILKAVLGQQLDLTGVALTHKGIHFFEHDGKS